MNRVNIYCCKCNNEMSIEFKYLESKTLIYCLNCNQKFPEKAFEHLKQCAYHLENVNNQLLENKNCTFHFSFESE